jgi:Flp pilus assembly protein TadG
MFNWLRRIRKDQRGNALMIGAATLPLLIGASAIGVDTIQLSLATRDLQRLADSAAIAAAHSTAVTPTDAVARASALVDLETVHEEAASMLTLADQQPSVGPGAGNPRAVRVVLTTSRVVPFMRFFTGRDENITVEATAQAMNGARYCLVALDDRVTTGLDFTGNSDLRLGCGVAANARGSSAVRANGSAIVFADPVAAVGRVDEGNKDRFRGPANTQPTLLEYNAPVADPFASRGFDPATEAEPCAGALEFDSLGRIKARCYNGPVTLPQNAVLGPGILYIRGGDLNVSGTLTGTNNTIVFMNRVGGLAAGELEMNGQDAVTLVSTDNPESKYHGIAVYSPTSSEIKYNGGQSLTITGALYFPNAHYVMNGNVSASTKCMQIVARSMEFKGGGAITNECDGTGGAGMIFGTIVRLIG